MVLYEVQYEEHEYRWQNIPHTSLVERCICTYLLDKKVITTVSKYYKGWNNVAVNTDISKVPHHTMY